MLKERFFEDLTPVETEMVREYVLHELCHGLEGTANAENLNDSVKECPRCGSEDFVKYGFNGKTQRFACKCCGRTFSSTTGTMFFSSSTDFETWSSFIDCEIKGLPLDEEAYTIHKSKTTCFNMRHGIMIFSPFIVTFIIKLLRKTVTDNFLKRLTISRKDRCFPHSAFACIID